MWQEGGRKPLNKLSVPLGRLWSFAEWAERLRSPDGELKTLNTRQMRFEPLGASDCSPDDLRYGRKPSSLAEG